MVTQEVNRVPLPLNITQEESSLYAPYQTYTSPVQKVKYLKNVFVTFSGCCINKNGLLKECHHDYPVQYDTYLGEASWYYHNAIEKPENLITLDDDVTYLVVHHPWYNYYHWLCESIFRLWIVRRRLNAFTLVLPEYYKGADFIQGSLEPFGMRNIYYIPNGKSLLIRNLCLPQIKPICDSYNTQHLKQVREFYVDYVRNRKMVAVTPRERLYVSRKLATRRKVVNEEELLAILNKYNFTIFYPENHTFLEQVAIFSNVQYLVGEHGSGLTNMLFMNDNSSILELHKNRTNELQHPSFLFWYMAESLNIHYYHQSCASPNVEDYFEGDYLVDPELFEHNLVKLLPK